MEPKITLKGFVGNWDTHAIKDICEVNPKSTLPSEFEYVDLESVVGTEMISHRTEQRGSAPSRAQRLAKKGDIFYQTVRPYQKNNYLFDMDETNYVFSTGYAQLRTKINQGYLFTLMQSPSFVNKVLLECTGTSYPAINPTNLSKITIDIVDDENIQRIIASYFQHLDSLIQSTAKKIDSLKQVKAASLQSMFPQEGEATPRVRFKGFEGKWEKVLASNVFKTFNEKNRPDLPVLSATQDKGMVTRDAFGYNISHDKSNESTYKHILPGQFVIHLRSFQGGFAHSTIEGIASPAYTVMEFKDKTQHVDLFWKYIFMSKEFIKRLELITYGIRDGRSISFEEFSDMSFIVPSYNEQQQIAKYFTTLDSHISLHSQRLEKLKQIKSACLENMFV
ncbi:type I restriction enzyme, S subunit [Prevotellaceae bacterium MN60]|nr:type I restriction enzyme, S subunit [Prevotellaceae bacterium MN60]